MNRLDFSSIMTIIRHYIGPDHGLNQTELLEELFYSLHAESKEPLIFDGASVNRWLKGTERISPMISKYYMRKRNQEKLSEDILQNILPLMYDSAMAAQELYRLTVQDASISERKKRMLLDSPHDTEEGEAALMTTLLCFGMERTFVRRTPQSTALMAAGKFSPVQADFILGSHVPAPCRHFCGRNAELTALHTLLTEEEKIFLDGIPGIGKSELAKAYARQHKAAYTNIIYLPYSGDLKQDISGLIFVDDQPEDDANTRWQRHLRNLMTLREDTLLIVDNLNTTAEEEPSLCDLLALPCRLLITTRCRYEEHATLTLTEISDDETLLHLMGCYYSSAARHRAVLAEIIGVVHRHTLAIEMAARLLETGILSPRELLAKLTTERAAFDASDTIGIHKDGHSHRATYYVHLHTLFSLHQLSSAEHTALRCLCLTPASGISARLLAKWLHHADLNQLNMLIRHGFVQCQPGRVIALHPMLHEIAMEELSPSVRRCRLLLESLQAICLHHGEDSPHAQIVFKILERTMLLAVKDDLPFYLRLLEDAVPCMEKHRYTAGITVVLREIESLLTTPAFGTTADQALLLSYQAMQVESPMEAIHMQEQALTLLPDITVDTALLAANLHANLGGMYREQGMSSQARQHMEHGLTLLQTYDLMDHHDSIPQAVNYAMLLSEMGQPGKAIAILEQVDKVVQKSNSSICLDTAAIHEAMGNIFLIASNFEQAVIQHQKCLAIYVELFHDQPDMLSAKQADLRVLYEQVGVLHAPVAPQIA